MSTSRSACGSFALHPVDARRIHQMRAPVAIRRPRCAIHPVELSPAGECHACAAARSKSRKRTFIAAAAVLFLLGAVATRALRSSPRAPAGLGPESPNGSASSAFAAGARTNAPSEEPRSGDEDLHLAPARANASIPTSVSAPPAPPAPPSFGPDLDDPPPPDDPADFALPSGRSGGRAERGSAR